MLSNVENKKERKMSVCIYCGEKLVSKKMVNRNNKEADTFTVFMCIICVGRKRRGSFGKS